MESCVNFRSFLESISFDKCYLLYGVFLALSIRLFLAVWKAWALNNGEVDSECLQLKGKGWGNLFCQSFLSSGKNVKVDDYWLPTIIGYFEIICFPLLLAKGMYLLIGGWITLKTISLFGPWQETRSAYNRFLLGNILSLGAAMIMFFYFTT